MSTNRERLTITLGWMVGVVWTASVIADLFIAAYEAPAALHGVMMIIVSSLYGRSILRRNGEA